MFRRIVPGLYGVRTPVEAAARHSVAEVWITIDDRAILCRSAAAACALEN